MLLIRNTLFALILLCACNGFASTTYQIQRPVFSGGGGQITGTEYKMRTVVIGQNMTPSKLSNNSYSTQANSGYVLMLAPNNAPKFTGEDNYYIAENLKVNPNDFNGATINEVLKHMSGDYSDIDYDTEFGLALTGVNNANGQWQYSLDNGANWIDILVASENNSLLLAADDQTRLRFKPDMDYLDGYPGDVTFRIWDQYRGTTGQSNVDVNETSWVYTFSNTNGILVGSIMDVPVAVPTLNGWGLLLFFATLLYFSMKMKGSQIVQFLGVGPN
ncbi:conserved hypothetical protein, secreted [Candidatus Magnetomorum sp. HK-1]|nr:conserved hypothetical protein, secreted [Candidatus Magnetomorum sp. HK-1]